MTWFPGAPKEKGIYWFDTGFANLKSYLISQNLGSDSGIWVYGHCGIMPINMVYSPKVSKKARCQKVKPPSGKWLPIKEIRKTKYAWVKSPEGYIGFCFFNPYSIIWETNPRLAYETGNIINSKYMFQVIEKP